MTSISAIFSQKKKRQCYKIFWREQFPLAWEAKVKKNPKNLKHLNKSNYLAGPNSSSPSTHVHSSLFLSFSPRLYPSPSHDLLPSSLTIALSHCQSLPLTCRSPSYYCSKIHSLGVSGKWYFKLFTFNPSFLLYVVLEFH